MKLEIKSTQCVSFERDKQKVILNKSKKPFVLGSNNAYFDKNYAQSLKSIAFAGLNKNYVGTETNSQADNQEVMAFFRNQNITPEEIGKKLGDIKFKEKMYRYIQIEFPKLIAELEKKSS